MLAGSGRATGEGHPRLAARADDESIDLPDGPFERLLDRSGIDLLDDGRRLADPFDGRHVRVVTTEKSKASHGESLDRTAAPDCTETGDGKEGAPIPTGLTRMQIRTKVSGDRESGEQEDRR